MINLFSHYANGEKLYEKIVGKVLAKYELTYMEFNIIMFLYNNPQYDTQAQLVSIRHLAKSHVSTSVKELVNRNFLTSEFYEKNHKTSHLKLTNLTDEIVRDGLEAQKEYRKVLTEGFTKEEIGELLEYISRIDENINKNL